MSSFLSTAKTLQAECEREIERLSAQKEDAERRLGSKRKFYDALSLVILHIQLHAEPPDA